MDKLELALKWRADVASGEMIETFRYRKNYLAYREGVTSKELDKICECANRWYESIDSPLRIGWSMGELRPGLAPQRRLAFGGQPT